MKYFKKRGFTLIEMLLVVLIIGILGAIALPQYQRALLKSRYAALMPIAKSMADSNEAYYLEHGEYADNAQDLPIQGRRNYSDGTELEFGTLTGYSYVLATRNNDFPNKYVVYQKHSDNFAGNTHCEALTNDLLAQELCVSLGGEMLGTNADYTIYRLTGSSPGIFPNTLISKTCSGTTCTYTYGNDYYFTYTSVITSHFYQIPSSSCYTRGCAGLDTVWLSDTTDTITEDDKQIRYYSNGNIGEIYYPRQQLRFRFDSAGNLRQIASSSTDKAWWGDGSIMQDRFYDPKYRKGEGPANLAFDFSLYEPDYTAISTQSMCERYPDLEKCQH